MTTFEDVFLRVQYLLEFLLADLLGVFHREILENLLIITSYANFTQDTFYLDLLLFVL